MCYVEGDSLAPCVALPGHGARVASLQGSAAALPALPALPLPLPAGQEFLPSDLSRWGAHKYFLAEVYSGQSAETWAAKVGQLEGLCSHALGRWQDRHPGKLLASDDVTQVVGAAALVFFAGDCSRLELLGKAEALVAAWVQARPGGALARLAAAGRLIVMVLHRAQAPDTFFQRSVASHLQRLQGIPEAVAELAALVKAALTFGTVPFTGPECKSVSLG